jgi:hypothetical protein
MAKPTIEELLQRLDESHQNVTKAMQGAVKVQREVLARFRELRRSMMGEVTSEKEANR